MRPGLSGGVCRVRMRKAWGLRTHSHSGHSRRGSPGVPSGSRRCTGRLPSGKSRTQQTRPPDPRARVSSLLWATAAAPAGPFLGEFQALRSGCRPS